MTFISCFNILTSLGILMIFLPSQLEAFYTSNTGCHHNGTWYADKSLVPTTEKCLNCQCNRKTLVCRLKVCPEMPMPPPRGCVVVQKKNTCCPYLSCARLDAFYKIPATRRIIAYLDHYERESIDRVVNENMLQRRSDDSDVDLYVCVKNGTVYKSGSAMSSSNLCSYCYCIGGTEKCVKPKCMLPVEGCKPIFVDSTCCPVRYDCSSKQTGKSSQEVRYRKTSNKHYLRMSQRLQRNHGCTVGQQFYTEGQKMKSDKNKPCDICFCIRGQRKCAPKKCAPALRNCIPVVPKGQCCPSSYDCGSQRDYRRSQNSRQFNLFSLLFGKDEEQDENAGTDIAVQYPHDREPVNLKPKSKLKQATTEKSLYDTIREGLEFIDSNNNQMIKDNSDIVDLPERQTELFKPAQPSPTPIPLSMHNLASSTEISFLDLLLGPSEPNELKTTEDESSEEIDGAEEQTTPTNTGMNWVDFLLGPDEEDLKSSASTTSNKLYGTDSTIEEDSTGLESSTAEVENSLILGENNIEEIKDPVLENLLTSTMDVTANTESETNEDSTQTLSPTMDEPAIETELYNITAKPTTTSTTTSTTTTKKPTTTAATTTTRKPIKTTLPVRTTKPLSPQNAQNSSKNQIYAQTKPEKKPDFLAQLLDGLNDILGRENKTRLQPTSLAMQIKVNKTTTTTKLPTAKPLPLFKPLPQDKTYNRINSKIANLTVSPSIISTKDLTKPTFKPMPTNNKIYEVPDKPSTTKQTTTATTLTSPAKSNTKILAATATATTTTNPTLSSIPLTLALTASSTRKPLVIKTNPTILESEPLDQNAEPTLPPSLPNLKIIPFLPTDAVKADHNPGSGYEFYHHSAAPISRIDYDLYDDANLYPSITEKYPLYADLEDGSKAEYIYKFNVEGPDSLLSSNSGKFDGTLGSPAFLKYDFAAVTAATASKGFSPPTKTEGGFVPKEPLILDDDNGVNVSSVNGSVKMGDNYHVTQHLIDITTAADITNTTKVIEITTPDPFKDVIRTEPPPDLTSLIEDKLKNLISKSNTTKATSLTTSNRIKKKPQNTTEMEMSLKQTDQNPMSLKTTTQIKMTATHIGDNKTNNRVQTEEVVKNNTTPRRTIEMLGDDMDHEINIDVNEVSTIPPFKSLPMAQQLLQDYTSTAIKEPTNSKTNNKLKQTETGTDSTIKPVGTATTIAAIKRANTTMTEAKRPAAATAIKVNRNKTIAMATKTATLTTTQQKPTKINKNSTLNGSEMKILSSSTATATATSSSSSSSPSTAGTVSTFKTKSNTIRRITSSKPIKQHKPTTNTILPTATIKSTAKTNAINIDRTSVASRRPPKPTTANANLQPPVTQTKTTSAAATKKPTTTKPPTRTTISLPSTATTTATASTTSFAPSSSTPFSSLQRVSSTNPFFMSPFDKLPFMDASFEVKRNSATPPTTTATTASTQQHFAVAATIATDALLDGANDEPDSHDDVHDDNDDAFTSSRHKLMGLVHYKHTLNQLEGLEPSTRQHPQHLSSSPHFGSRVSSPTSTASQHQHQRQPQQQQQSPSINNLIDPTGILKLAGCNIYGRMYRVGRIILELSSPCLECKCTEIGVKCGPLDC